MGDMCNNNMHIRNSRMSNSSDSQARLISLLPRRSTRQTHPARNGTFVNETWRSACGREREPESRGDAAVPPDGAEADIATPNGADATADDCTDLSVTGLPFRALSAPNQGRSASNPERWRRRQNPDKETASSGAERRLIGPRPRFSTALARMHITTTSD